MQSGPGYFRHSNFLGISQRPWQNKREVVQFQEGPTKTRSGGLTILQRTTLQAMYSTNGGKTDQVHLFKLWLSNRPNGMKDKGPLCLSV